MAVTTPFDITITLTKEEVAIAIAEYTQKKLGDEFSVLSGKVEFKLTKVYDDRPGGSSSTIFEKAILKANKI